MANISIEGNNNITNGGVIGGNFIVGDVYIGLPGFKSFNILNEITMNETDKEQTILNITESQKKLASAIEKFADAELLRAEADKNNSLANLNYSKVMLEDREILKTMIDKLK